jgi:uncharacterized membrane protein
MEKEQTNAEIRREQTSLKRLQTLLDVLYALMIFRLWSLLPRPTQEQIETRDLFGMFDEHGIDLLIMVIGIILVIIYWGQSNQQLGNLERVDGRIGVLAIVQVFSLMLFLYFIGLDNRTHGDEFTLLMQSIFLALAGFIGIYNFNYAERKGFYQKDLTKKELIAIVTRFYAEPIVAVLTIPFAFFGPNWYGIGWLLLIPTAGILKRRKKKKLEALDQEAA